MENVQSKPRLAISFSGGRSSAVMTRICLTAFRESHDIIVTFANTGCEHENTLQFVHDCDKYWGFGTVWVEAIIGGAGVGPRAKVVTFETASRNGEPFEAAIAKHGVFNAAMPNCTGRLKVDVMKSYLRDHAGWENLSYDTAIGIRADEIDRCAEKAKEQRLIYPLVAKGYGKKQVNAMMRQAEFDLKLPGDHYGNCVWCWKKSMRKLLTVAKHTPEAFEFPRRMERQYGHVMPQRRKDKGVWEGKNRTFFRKGISGDQLVEMAAAGNFTEYIEKMDQMEFQFWDDAWDDEMDVGGGCGDSCEIGADEQYDETEQH